MNLSRANLCHYPWNVVATAKGYGFGWHVCESEADQDVTIVLEPEAHLRGRLLEPGGKPAAGVRVQILIVDDQLNPDPRAHHDFSQRLELDWSRLPYATQTDAEGRFHFAGVIRNRRMSVVVDDPRFARKWLNCATVDNDLIDYWNLVDSPDTSKLLPNGFTATLEPSRIIRGRVTYADSAKPAAGAIVCVGLSCVVTDKNGHYSLAGFAAGRCQISVRPAADTEYLQCYIEKELPAKSEVPEQNFALQRGAVITGVLRDKETGEPIRMENIDIGFQSTNPTPARQDGSHNNGLGGRTKSDGSFRMVVEPGQGNLCLRETVPGYLPIDVFEGRLSARQWDAEPIDGAKPGDTVAGQDLRISRGTVVRGRIVDASGQGVGGAIFQGVTEQRPSSADGSFCLSGLSPKQKSHFVVLHAQRRLGAKIVIEPDHGENEQMTVKLLPTQTANLNVLTEAMRPAAGARICLKANIGIEQTATLSGYRPVTVEVPRFTDETGTCKFSNLVVGGSYTVDISAYGYARAETHVRVEAGKSLEPAPVILLAAGFTLSGIVVDQNGKPVQGVQVSCHSRNPTLFMSDHHWLETKKDGRFAFYGLTKDKYRLQANLFRKTGGLIADTGVKAEAGFVPYRLVLEIPK